MEWTLTVLFLSLKLFIKVLDENHKKSLAQQPLPSGGASRGGAAGRGAERALRRLLVQRHGVPALHRALRRAQRVRRRPLRDCDGRANRKQHGEHDDGLRPSREVTIGEQLLLTRRL